MSLGKWTMLGRSDDGFDPRRGRGVPHEGHMSALRSRRSRARHAVAIWLLAGAGLLQTACADDPPDAIAPIEDAGGRDAPVRDSAAEPDGVYDDPEVGCVPVLVFITEQAPTVSTDSGLELHVRLTDCDGTPMADTIVSFALIGDGGDSWLQADSALTDAAGEAAVMLWTGLTETTFQVEVSAEGAAPIGFDVTVFRPPTGAIRVSLVYGGGESFDRFLAFVYLGEPCGDLDPFDLSDALRSAPALELLEGSVRFEELPPGESYLVAVQAEREGQVLGFGCTAGLSVEAGRTTEAVVDIADLPIVFSGVYDLDNRFDLSNALPPSVSTPLQVFDELTDDDDLEGDITNESYGLDPAAFLLDFVYREFCCWEALDAEPDISGFQADYYTCDAQDFQHPWGDLSAIYLYPFQFWDGAQAVFFGLCGALGSGANEALQELVQELILENVPDVALRLLDIVGDLSRAFTEMHILSELTIGDVYIEKDGHFTHELVSMVVELHDLDGNLNTYEFALAEAGLSNLSYSAETTVSEGNVLLIPAHSFRLDFGKLLLYVYRDVLLPNLDCDPDGDGTTEPCETTGDLFATWVNCGSVGATLALEVGFFDASTYTSFCKTGLDLAGYFLEGQLMNSTDYETVITIEGQCLGDDVDARRVVNTLRDGTWEGTLEEDSEVIGDFDGTFTGTKRPGS